MATFKISLDRETHKRLLENALAERRPLAWQAQILIMRMLGVPIPEVLPPTDDLLIQVGANIDEADRKLDQLGKSVGALDKVTANPAALAVEAMVNLGKGLK